MLETSVFDLFTTSCSAYLFKCLPLPWCFLWVFQWCLLTKGCILVCYHIVFCALFCHFFIVVGKQVLFQSYVTFCSSLINKKIFEIWSVLDRDSKHQWKILIFVFSVLMLLKKCLTKHDGFIQPFSTPQTMILSDFSECRTSSYHSKRHRKKAIHYIQWVF